MNLLITGGAGFIGSNLVHHVINRPEVDRLVNLDCLTYAGNPENLADVASHPKYAFEKVDLRDKAEVLRVVRQHAITHVMHLAAESHVDRSIDGPGTFVETNVIGTFNLLEACRACWPAPSSEHRFLHVSTDEVYGSLGATGLFTEDTPYDPHSPYSATKASSDHLARAWFDTYGLPVLVTNCSNNYGPYQFPEKLIPVVILKALRGDPISVYGQGLNIRDWLYVGDHADALFTVLAKGQPGQTYNIGGNNERRNIDLVRLLCSILDELRPRADGRPYAGQITFVTDRPGHDQRYAIDASKIRRELGWAPKQDHSSGFRLTVQWYLDNERWWQDILSGKYKLERLGTAPK